MISDLAAFLRSAVGRRWRDLRSDVAVLAAVVLLGTVSLGFATAAAFAQLRTVAGTVEAATIMAGAYAAVAILTAAVWMLRRRGSRVRATSPAPGEATSATVDPLQVHASEAGVLESQTLLMQAMKLGSELSTPQLLVAALIGGFVAGRNIRK